MVDFKMVHSLSKDFNVLYVKDSNEINTDTTAMLKKYFASLDIAVDGQDAVEKYKAYCAKNHSHYDVVLTHIQLSYLNGIELCNIILELHNDQPIIIISEYPDPMYLFELMNLGVSSFISIPIQENQLNRVFYRKFQEISKLKEEHANREYEKFERKFLMGVMDLQDNIIITTSGEDIQSANQALLNFFNFDTLDDFNKEHSCICKSFINTEGYFHSELLKNDELWTNYILNRPHEDIVVMMTNRKTLQDESFKVTVNYFHEINKYIVTFTNITKIALTNKSNHQKAIYDNLTGIYNRHKLHDLIEKLFDPTQKYHFALIIFDIDHFKRINDKFGHLVGDKVLKDVTEIIKQNIRASDIFVRWGGDEFILIIQDIDTAQKAIKIADHLRSAIQTNVFEDIGKLTCSFGLSLYREDNTINTILDRADKALYKSKDKGRNSVTFL